MFVLKVKKVEKSARLPGAAHDGDLGCDLYALDDTIISPGGQVGVRTGIALEFPEGWGGIIKDRSSMAAKRVYTSAGVIDAGYRGEVIVLLRNDNASEYAIKAKDKIAQIVPVKSVECVVEEAEGLSETSRSDGGFGSTGS